MSSNPMKPIVRIENVSKQFRIGAREPGYDTLRESIIHALNAPFRRLRRQNGKPKNETIWALKDVSFNVAEGEVVGVIGRNGAGKSTLLKVLSRITEPTVGRIRLYGRVASLLEVGTGFHPELTGRENIYLNGAILGMTKAEIDRKFDEIVDFAELEKFLDTPVKRYSSGMYMRLAFAVASHLEPEILLVDEVLAVGDAAFQKKCLGKMGEVAKQGRTVLFISHNMTAIRSLCGRAIWLDGGQVVGSGETGQVVLEYLQKGAISNLEQVWPDPLTAPGNEKVKIRHARLGPLAPGEFDDISVESAIQIEFEFWIYEPGIVLNFTIHLLTIEGTYVFAASSEVKPRPRGSVTETITIPANLLNDGIYTLTIQVVQDMTSSLYLHPDILVFEVLDSVREGNWFGKWPGVIRPKLEWVSESVVEGSGHEYK
jgi:lipopolysaccharide transport system ATP-binding protein